MKPVTLTLPQLKCRHCGYTWVPRMNHPPKVCPSCKSRVWQKEKKEKPPTTKEPDHGH